jgi:hypothetical protein
MDDQKKLELAFKSRLLKLSDGAKEVLSLGGTKAAVIKVTVKEAGELAAAKKFKLAMSKLDDLEKAIQGNLDAHGNVREIAQKEDSLVKKAVQKVPPRAKQFQQKNFGGRMKAISGMDVDWDKMTGGKSNPFDVISQKGGDKGVFPSKPGISYVTFQDSMYAEEPPGSREKLVRAFYKDKLDSIKDEPAKKKLEEAIAEMDRVKKALEEKKATPEEFKAAVNKAFTAMGMKGVREGVEKTRGEIKDRLFLGKENPALNRGRVSHTMAVSVLGFASKAQEKLKNDPTKLKEFNELLKQVKQWKAQLTEIQKQMTGFIGLKLKEGEKEPEELTKLKKKESTLIDGLKTKAEEAFAYMKGLDLGLDAKGGETSGGIGSDDGSGPRDVYKTDTDVHMGKNVNIRDDESGASAIFRELGIPFTGGASGSTVDAVGGIVDTLLREGEDPTKALEDNDSRLVSAEAEICMYIMGMHTAGHHSLVEMIYAAKQYPQKFFRKLRDPITDAIESQQKLMDFYKDNPLSKFQNPQGKPQLNDKELRAKQDEARLKAVPEPISHEDCINAFMKHCDEVLAKV